MTSDPEDLKDEIKHVNNSLKRCHYPEWAIRKVTKSLSMSKEERDKKKQEQRKSGQGTYKSTVVMPYQRGKSEHIRRIFQRHKVNVCFRPQRTLRQILVHPKDKPNKQEICGPIYHIKCLGRSKEECEHGYIGETERTLKARFMEHRRPSSTTSEVSQHIHSDSPGHTVSLESVTILDRDPSWFSRGVKEAIYIRAHRPSLNKDGGRFNLSHIWDSQLTPLTEGGVNPHVG